jgi:hypothetical protein
MDDIDIIINLDSDNDASSIISYESDSLDIVDKPQNRIINNEAVLIDNIQEEDNLVQYTEKQFLNRSQHEIDIEALKQELMNSIDSTLHENYIQSNSPISMSNNGSIDGSEHNMDTSIVYSEKYKNLSFHQVQQTIDKYYEDSHSNKYSSEIDILTTYIKGQKTLFVQSKYLTQWKLNCLMFPCLFITAAITIIAPFVECHHWSPGFISGLNACIALFLSLISYLKLESSTEIYLFMANHYDKIETILNMTNSKLSIIDNDEEKKTLVLKKLNEIESKIKDLKESYTLLIPEEVKKRFPIICNINIFLFIKKMEMHKKNLIIKFRDVKNEIRYILYRWKTDTENENIEKEKEKHRLSYLYMVKGNLKNEIIKYRNAYSKMDELFTQELRGNQGSPFNPLLLHVGLEEGVN